MYLFTPLTVSVVEVNVSYSGRNLLRCDLIDMKYQLRERQSQMMLDNSRIECQLIVIDEANVYILWLFLIFHKDEDYASFPWLSLVLQNICIKDDNNSGLLFLNYDANSCDRIFSDHKILSLGEKILNLFAKNVYFGCVFS